VREGMTGLSARVTAQRREQRECAGKTPHHHGCGRIQETDSDCRRRLRRQMQKTRLRQRQPLKRAEMHRAQNTFTGPRHQCSDVINHAMRKHRHGAGVIVRTIRIRGMLRCVRCGMRIVMRTNMRCTLLPFFVQPDVQLRADTREREQHHEPRRQRSCGTPEA